MKINTPEHNTINRKAEFSDYDPDWGTNKIERWKQDKKKIKDSFQKVNKIDKRRFPFVNSLENNP